MSGQVAANGELDVFDNGAGWEFQHVLKLDVWPERHIVDDAGCQVMKMPVLGEVRAEARRPAVKVHLTDDTMFDHRVEARVNGGQRKIRQRVPDPHEHGESELQP